MKISLIIVTYNRPEIAERAFHHNIQNAGHTINEVIWVDNLSEKFPILCADKVIMHNRNLGFSKGYNTGILNSSGTHMVILGCDLLMPKDWLKTYVQCFEAIPNTGVVSTYSKPLDKIPERLMSKSSCWINGIEIQDSLPMEVMMFSRNFLKQVGYFREDFGLYGWEDVEWGNRSNRVANECRYLNYTLPKMMCEHLGCEGVDEWDGRGDQEYHAFKKKESEDPKKKELLEKCRLENWPYYNPYS